MHSLTVFFFETHFITMVYHVAEVLTMIIHPLIIFLFYIIYLWLDLKLMQLFTAVVVNKYSSLHCLYTVTIEVSYYPWRLCSYFIHFFFPYLFPNTLIGNFKPGGLLGVFLSKKASQVAVFWEEAPLASWSSVGGQLLVQDLWLTHLCSLTQNGEYSFWGATWSEAKSSLPSIKFRSLLPYSVSTLSMSV